MKPKVHHSVLETSLVPWDFIANNLHVSFFRLWLLHAQHIAAFLINYRNVLWRVQLHCQSLLDSCTKFMLWYISARANGYVARNGIIHSAKTCCYVNLPLGLLTRFQRHHRLENHSPLSGCTIRNAYPDVFKSWAAEQWYLLSLCVAS
jgi:hypothetical protein